MSVASSERAFASGAADVWVDLPKGLRGRDGVRRRWAKMRAATGLDEIRALSDFRVFLRPECFSAVLLARVVTALSRSPQADGANAESTCAEGTGTREIDATLFEGLDEADRDALESAYRRLNDYELPGVAG